MKTRLELIKDRFIRKHNKRNLKLNKLEEIKINENLKLNKLEEIKINENFNKLYYISPKELEGLPQELLNELRLPIKR